MGKGLINPPTYPVIRKHFAARLPTKLYVPNSKEQLCGRYGFVQDSTLDNWTPSEKAASLYRALHLPHDALKLPQDLLEPHWGYNRAL